MAVIKIAKRGDDCGNLVRYLFGKGKHNEHTNQRTIAGTTHAHSGPWDKQSIHQVVTDLRAFSQANPQSRIGQENKHIWHAAISLPPGETLTDQGWARLAQEYMRGMGFDDPAKAPIRWTAIHHGSSREGNDHIHIVMSMIRQDGAKVRVHEDAKRSRPVLTGIEQRLGLQVLRPSPTGARPITYKAGERGKAEDRGHPIEREDLARRVRAAATASKTEAEFVRRLRGQGLDVRPREGTGAQAGTVTGYSVGFPGGTGFAGGKLGRDLSLPRLRQSWNEDAHGREQAAGEWLLGTGNTPRVKYGRETRKNVPLPDDVKKELADAHFQLAAATSADFAALSADLAGALSLASAHDPRLYALSREVGRAAQTPEPFRRRSGGTFLNLGLFVLALTDADPRTREMLMLRQVVAMLVTMVQTHRARAAAINQGRSTGMSQPDASDELTEMGVTTGVTLGAAGVQMALQRLHRGPERRTAAAAPSAAATDPVRPTVTLETVHRKLDALNVPEAGRSGLSTLGPEELADLTARLDETLSQTPGAREKETLLAFYDDNPGEACWVLTASQEEIHERFNLLRTDYDGSASRSISSNIPNWRTGGEPMTPNQRFTLEKYCKQFGLDPHQDLTVKLPGGATVGFQDFTKAQASGAISEFIRVQREGTRTPVPTGVGVGNSDPRSAAVQQAIVSLPGGLPANSNAPHIQPADTGKNVGRGGRF